MNLIIKQSNTPESVTSELIDRLYNLTKPDPITGQPAANAVLVGRITAPAAYEDAVNFLNTQFSSSQDNGSDLQIAVLNNNYYIRFADSAVEEVLKLSMGKDEGEGITVAEASNTFANYFQNNTDIESFNELKHFKTGNYNFNGCTNLESVDITDKVGYFQNCTNLVNWYGGKKPDGYLYIGNPLSNAKSCPGLTELEIGEEAPELYNGQFEGSANITILRCKPVANYTFGYPAFRGAAVKNVYIESMDNWLTCRTYGSGMLDSNTKIFYNNQLVTSVEIPQTITQIGANNGGCFAEYRHLTSIQFHSGIISITLGTFKNCTNLVIPDLNLPNLTTLGSSAFYNTKVQTISNLGSVSTIPNECFRNTPLTSIAFPQTLTSIGEFSLYSSVRHTYSFYVSDIDNWINCTKADSFIADEDRYDLYLNNTLVNSISLTGYTTIKQGAFRAMHNAISITLPSTITTIKEYAFFNSNVTINDINLPNLTILERYAFAHNKGTESATINTVSNLGAVTQISDHCFYGCSSLTSITIPNSVTSIGGSAFGGCSGLTSVTIPNSVTSIGWGAFQNCSGLTSLTIPDSVTSLGGSSIIAGCTNLQSLTLGNGLTSIPAGAFKDANNMTAPLIIPDSVTTIGNEAFGKNKASSIIIGTGITEIGEIAFYHNQACTSITIKATNPPILKNTNAFQTNGGGVKTCPIYVPAGSVDAYKTAAVWKDLPNADTRIKAIET